MRLTKFSLSPKIRSFLTGALVFCITFVLSFIVFGGLKKLQRIEEAKQVEILNKQYYAQKKQKEEKRKQTILEAQSILDAQTTENPDVTLENTAVSPETQKTDVQTTGMSREKQIEILVARFSTVLDLSTNEEWKSYPEDLRKEAFAIMNAQKAEQTTTSHPQKQDPQVIDKIFQGETEEQNTQKWGDYIVLSGDTWNSIATKYQTSSEDLQLMNPDIKRLFPGNKIIVPYQQ